MKIRTIYWASAAAAGLTACVPSSSSDPETTISEAGPMSFLSLAKVAPGVTACDNESFTASGCYNLELPPTPSTLRRQHAHQNEGDNDPQSNVKPRSDEQESTVRAQTYQLGTRTTLDGRLHIIEYGDRAKIAPVYPENLTYGFQTEPGRKVRPNTLVHVEPWMRMSFETGLSHHNLKRKNAFYRFTGGTDICSRGQASLPYPCVARYSASEPARTGQCYDVSIISGFAYPGPGGGEIRSNDLTIFAQNLEYVPRPGDNVDRKMWLYPTVSIEALGGQMEDGRLVLPPYAPLAMAKNVFDAEKAQVVLTGNDEVKRDWMAAHVMDRDYCRKNASPPAWCAYFARQAHNHDPARPDSTKTKQGGVSRFSPIEMSTTGDGHVLVGQDAYSGSSGFFYTYTPEACNAAGWSTIKALSRAYSDPDVHGTYGFAEYPVIYPDGSMAEVGDQIGGAYPWIDRAGANVFLGSHIAPFGWRACAPSDIGSVDSEDPCAGPSLDDLNEKNAKAPKVVGLWTRGKMVHLDGVINGSDWTARDGGHPFYVRAFSDGPWTKLRPGNNTDFFSFENLFNHLDHMSPLLPFDVVWTMTAGSNRVNAEVAFDDYMTEGALILAPMNDRLQLRPTWQNSDGEFGALNYWRQNGMSFPGLNQPNLEDQKFTGHGIYLQNNAPRAGGHLPVLSLRGGAFIPPLSTGVMGKAVFLDGRNDRIEVNRVDGYPSSYYLSVWVELHSTSTRTLFAFPDDSMIRISPNSIWLNWNPGSYDSNSGCYLSGGHHNFSAPIGYKRWTHVAFAFHEHQTVDVYVDGQLIATKDIPNGFRLYGNQTLNRFNLGVNRQLCYFGMHSWPVRGWVDDLKLFAQAPGESAQSHFAEVACNHALGSLDGNGDCEQLDFRQLEVPDHDGRGSGLEFPLATYQSTDCGSSSHRNIGAECGRKEALGVAPLDPDLPRPGADDNAFCRSCHSSDGPAELGGEGDVAFDLSLDALVVNPGLTAHEDRRRQPLQYSPGFDHLLWESDRDVKMGCGVGFVEAGRFAVSTDHVNVHRDRDGDWVGDGDCTSSADQDDVAYCQNWWPASSHRYRTVVGPKDKPFVTLGCADDAPQRGEREYVCCIPQ